MMPAILHLAVLERRWLDFALVQAATRRAPDPVPPAAEIAAPTSSADDGEVDLRV